MKIALLTLLLALTPTIVISEENTARARMVEYKHLNEKIESLEKAIRLQTLTTEAVRKENYDLACKAQKEATIATRQANVVDVNGYSDKQYAEICTISRATAEPNIPSWLKPVAGFEPAGVYVEGRR
jgi:DNA-directed RNA polymerase specialized sigma54-like protein